MKNLKTTIRLIRHGESQANRRDAFLGHGDLELTDTGYAQAALAAQFLKEEGADVIYSSDLRRAYETAKQTAQLLGLPIITDPNLREINAGKWDNLTFKQLTQQYAKSYEIWVRDVANARCDGGESVSELQDRVLAAVTRIVQENVGKRILIFSHGTPIRAMAAHAMGKAIGDIPWPANTSTTTLEYSEKGFTCVEYSREDYMGALVTRLPDGV